MVLMAAGAGKRPPKEALSLSADASRKRLARTSRGFLALEGFDDSMLEQNRVGDGHSAKPKNHWLNFVIGSSVTWLIWVALTMLAWSAGPYDEDIEFAASDPAKTFRVNHFGCLKTPEICCCALVCPALRWAQTIDQAGLKKMSGALSLFFLCGLLNSLVYTFCFFGVFTCFLMLYFRQRIRVILGLPSWTLGTCCFDFFYVVFCCCCAIAQEARVIHQANSVYPPDKDNGHYPRADFASGLPAAAWDPAYAPTLPFQASETLSSGLQAVDCKSPSSKSREILSSGVPSVDCRSTPMRPPGPRTQPELHAGHLPPLPEAVLKRIVS